MTKKTTLQFKEGNSDKTYEVWLEATPSGKSYKVNFAYGRTGGNLKGGTKTPRAVALEKAEEIFEKLVTEKKKKGYKAKRGKGAAKKKTVRKGLAIKKSVRKAARSNNDKNKQKKFEIIASKLCKTFKMKFLDEKDRPIFKLKKKPRLASKAAKSEFSWDDESCGVKLDEQINTLFGSDAPKLLSFELASYPFNIAVENFKSKEDLIKCYLGNDVIISCVDIEDLTECFPENLKRHATKVSKLIGQKKCIREGIDDEGYMIILSLGENSCLFFESLTGRGDQWDAPLFELCSIFNYEFMPEYLTFFATCGGQSSFIITMESKQLKELKIDRCLDLKTAKIFSKSWEEDGDLDFYWNITDDASKVLSKCDFESLSLNGLKTISDKSAQALIKFEGDLFLNGLQKISDKTAEVLANFNGYDLCLNEELEAKVEKFRDNEPELAVEEHQENDRGDLAQLSLKDIILEITRNKVLTPQEILKSLQGIGYKVGVSAKDPLQVRLTAKKYRNPLGCIRIVLYSNKKAFKNIKGKFTAA